MKDSIESSVGKGNIFPLHTFMTLAKRWGVTHQTVINWSKRHKDFPEPVNGYVSSDLKTKFFSLKDIEAYEKKRKLNKPLDK